MPKDVQATDGKETTDTQVADGGEDNSVKKPVEKAGLFDAQRDQLYADYYGEEESDKSDSPDQKPSGDDQEDGDHDTDSAADVMGESDDDKSDGNGDVPDDKEQKMVPLAALHEERGKRQSLQSDVTDLSKQNEELSKRVRQLLEDNNKFLDLLQKKGESPDYEAEVNDDLDDFDRSVKKDLEELKEYKRKEEEAKQAAAAAAGQAKMQENIDRVSAELEKEGVLGFNTFGLGLMKQKMFEKLNEVGAERIREFDNPEGWKKTYKEEIWPTLCEKFDIKPLSVKKDNDDKIEKKKKAKLPTGPTNLIPKTDDDDAEVDQEAAFADYIKRRRSQQLG